MSEEAEPPDGQTRRGSRGLKKYAWRVAGGLLVYMVVLRPIAIIALCIPGPWGPSVSAVTPEGINVTIRCRRFGGETDELLYLDRPGEPRKEFIINNTHALDMWYVRAKYTPDVPGIWLESGGSVVCSLDLRSEVFKKEGAPQLPWARIDSGTVIAEGMCRHWWELLLPL